MAKKTSVPVAPEAKEVLGAVKTVPTKAPVPGMDGVGAKTAAKQIVKREEEEKEVVSDMDAQAADVVAQEAPVLVAQAAAAPAPTSSDGSATAAPVQAGASAPAAATAVSPLWLGVGAIGLAAAAGGGGGDDAPPAPEYKLTAKESPVDEGYTAVFVLETKNVAAGKSFDYEIRGVSNADVVGGKLDGSVVVGADGKAEIRVQLVADRVAEGAETLSLTVAGKTVGVVVNDTSFQTLALSKSALSVNEGEAVVFTLTTTNVDAGETFDYVISGVEAADVVGGALTGTAVIGADGKAEIRVQLVADRATEGAETLTLNVAGQTQSVTVIDTSVDPTYVLSAAAATVDEGQTAVFTLQTTNVDPGATFDYVITGVSPADVVGGALTGTAVIGADGKAEIRVQLAQDNLSEGTETITLTVAGQTQDVTVNDTSVDPTQQFTIDADDLKGNDTFGNLFVARVSSTFGAEGQTTTFNDGDILNGRGGSNTLRLFMDPGATADGVEVSNIQTLDLRLNAAAPGAGSPPPTTLVMTDWDARLQQMNIRSNKSNLVVEEQKKVAGITITDQSNAATASSYDFGYAAGVLDGPSDHLNLSVDNVNGTGGATVTVDDGMESIAITVADRPGTVANPNLYASNINLVAGDVAELDVTGGLSGQAFTLDADVAPGAVFDSTTFDGNMVLTSADIRTAGLGKGSDNVTVTGQANLSTSSYHLGSGNNTFTYTGTLAGDVTALGGDDTVSVGATTADATIDVGNGATNVGNTVTITGAHAGTVFGGNDRDVVSAGSTAVGSSITLGNGSNQATVTGAHLGSIVGGDNFDSVSVNSTGVGSVIGLGAGGNSATVTTTHAGSITGLNGADNVTVGSTTATGSITLFNGQNTVTVGTEHAGSITTGVNEDTITVGNSSTGGGLVTGSITTGDGTDEVTVYGDVTNADIDLGGGNNNVLTVTGNISRSTPPTSITFGNGSGNLLDVTGNITNEAVVFGSLASPDPLGLGNQVDLDGNLVTSSITFNSFESTVDIGGNVTGSTITFGDGANVANIVGDVTGGSQITFGTGADTLTLGDGGAASPELSGTNVRTVIDMGDADDHVTIIAGHNDAATTALVQSGARLAGGNGTVDQLTVRAVDNIAVVARDVAQQVTIDLARTDPNNYAINDVVTVTIGGTDYTYKVREADIIEGDGVATSNNVAAAVAAAITSAAMTDSRSGSLITLDGTLGNADVSVTAEVTRGTGESEVVTPIVPTVVQIANAQITGFETLNLVATNPLDVNNNATRDAGDTDGDRLSADISANFELITGVQNVNLVSEVALIDAPRQTVSSPAGLAASGYLVTSYTPGVGVNALSGIALTTLQEFRAGDPNVFTLTNLQGTESIKVSADEITATGNRQVDSISISTTDDTYKVGDIITVTVGGVPPVSIEITEQELTPGNAAGVDANLIATKLAAAIGINKPGVNAYVSNNLVYIAGEPGVDVGTVAVTHARPAEATIVSLTGQTNNVTLAAPGALATANIVYNVNEQPVNGASLPQGDNVQYKVGDVFTFTFGTAPNTAKVEYTITTADLASDCDRVDLDTLTANIAKALRDSSVPAADKAEASFGGAISGLTGSYSWTQVREINATIASATTAGNLLADSPTDDDSADVTLTASRAADSTDAGMELMELKLEGRGNFDLDITGNNAANGYTDLSLTLSDGFDHTVDLNGGTYSLVGAGVDVVQGNFSKSVTIEGGVEGQNIVLAEVLARNVNTAGANANFTIDQYTGVRATAADFAGEVISVTTGSGDDHLRTLAPSALTDNSGSGGQQSSINLGAGSNTLSLGWGNGVTLGSAELAALGNIDYSGDLTRLNILNAVELANGSATVFRMPGQVTGVDVLTFTDVDVVSNGVATLTIEGAASTFRIESEFDLAEDQEDRIVLEVVGVENLSIEVGDEVNVDLNGASLQTLEVVAGDDVDFVMDGSKTGNNNFVNLSSVTLTADDNVDAEISHVLGGATLSVTGDANKGNNGYADVTVSHVTLGDVSVVSTGDGSDFAELNVSNTVGTASSTAAASMGNVTVISNADASLLLENNRDANVNVSGTVDISGLGIDSFGDAARLVVSGNIRTNVSLADGGTIDLVACGPDDDTRVTINNNLNNFLPDFGNPDQTAVTDRSYAINLGAIVADAGEDTIVSLTNNNDTTYYGDLAVTVDRVDLFAYEDASVTIDGNNAATITLGTVDLLSQVDGSLAITNNDGGIYTVTPPGGSTRREVDFADITIGNVTIDADVENRTDTSVQGDASFTVTGNDIARVQIGTVDVDAGGDATFRIDNNDDTTVTTLGVTINAEATVDDTLTFSISDNDRVDNGAETVPPLASSVTINGDVTLTAPSTTTVIDIDGNDGLSATERSTVTVNGSFHSTSGDSITASINDNSFADIDLGGNVTTAEVNLTSTAGDSTLTIDANTDITITMASTTLQANGAGNVARLDFGSVNAPGLSIPVIDTITPNAGTIGVINVGEGIYSATNFTTETPGNIVDPVSGQVFDIDWFKVDLVAGTQYQISVFGSGAGGLLADNGTSDPFVTVYQEPTNSGDYAAVIWPGTLGGRGHPDGTDVLAANDDALGSLNAGVLFTPTATGTYYFDVRPYRSDNDPGTYLLEVWENPGSLVNTPRFADSARFVDVLYGGGNQNTDITLADLTINSTDNVAELLVRNNAGGADITVVTVTGPTVIDGATEANLSILGNFDVAVDLSTTGTVKLDARAPSGDATVGITGNTTTTVEMGVLDVDAPDQVDVDIRSNTDTDVRTGNIDIDAGGAATFDVVGNTGSATDIELAVVRNAGTGAVTSRGSIAINAASVGDYDNSWGFLVEDNDGSEVFLGDVGIVTTDGVIDNSNDVKMGIFAGEDELIDVGNIAISADNDVYAQISNDDFGYGTTVRTGDIVISSGNEPWLDDADLDVVADDNPNVFSDLYFSAVNLEGNDLNDNTSAGDNGQQITLTANSRGTGEGFVYANIANAPDLTTLTVSGTNAEIYLTGTMGPTDSVQGTFTLDLSGMTGTFDTITTYDPLGASADHNRAQDDGTYVVTVGATFDNDLRDMVVKIGTGDLVYNAQHSAFEGSDTDFVYGYDAVNDESDWGGKEGWFSLGTGLDLSPVRATQVIGNILLGDNWDESGDGGRLGVNELVVNAGQRSYVVTWDGGGNLESDFRVNWNGSTGQSLDWLARELGGSNATVSFTVGGDDDENYVTGTITIQGPSNGYDFADADLITGASLRGLQYFYDDDDGRAWEALNYDETLTPTFTAGDAANDGLGNVASEVFRFTGTGEDMDIGDVVIGGFRPNGFFISGQQDRLDFSAFADIRNADDLIITIEKGGSYVGEEGGTGFTGDANGYFDDVIIDFVNQEYGSIRLVGVGEYFTDANVNGIANSIIFV